MPTASSVGNDSGFSVALPVSKLMFCSRILPVSINSVSRSITSIGQPFSSTLRPAGVSAHWSRPSHTPSPSASAGSPSRPRAALGRVRALVEAVEDAVAVGVARAALRVHRRALGRVRRTGPGRRTRRRRPRRSGSRSCPPCSPWACPRTCRGRRTPRRRRRRSGQPFASTLAPIGVFGHLSSQSRTLSRSWSRSLPPHSHVSPTVAARWFENPAASRSRKK